MPSARIQKLFSILLVTAALLLTMAGVVALVLIENLEEYLFAAIGIAAVVFTTCTLLIIEGFRKYKNPPRTRGKTIAFNTVSGSLFALVVTACGILSAIYLIPGPPKLYPRQYPITIPAGYHFSTQYGDLNQTSEAILSFPQPLPDNPDNYAWGESYHLRSLIFWYLSNQTNQSLLDHIMARIDTILDHSDRNGDGVPGFGTATYEDQYVEYFVWDGVILAPIVAVGNIIKANTTLWAIPAYRDAAINYSDTAEKVIQRWNATNWREAPAPDGSGIMGYYLSTPQNTTAIFNRIDAMGLLALEVFEFTDNQSYKIHAEKIARFLKSKLRANTYTIENVQKTMYAWSYDWNGGVNSFSDTSHACIDAEFMAECYAAGIVFTAEDMRRFSNTFVDFVYRGRDFQVSQMIGGVNYTNVLAHEVNGRENPTERYYSSIRQGWLQLALIYSDVQIGNYVCFQVMEDLIRGNNVGICIQQTIMWLRYACFVERRCTYTYA